MKVKWKELHPVKRGDLVSLTLDGQKRHYRARRSVQDIGNLRLCDLQPDPETDANAFMAKVINHSEEGQG